MKKALKLWEQYPKLMKDEITKLKRRLNKKQRDTINKQKKGQSIPLDDGRREDG